MKDLLIVLIVAAFGAAAVIAQPAKEDAIKELETKVNFKLNVLSSCADANFVETKHKLDFLYKELAAQKELTENRIRDIEIHVGNRLDKLERKVAGMQKQITILHAKKVNK